MFRSWAPTEAKGGQDFLLPEGGAKRRGALFKSQGWWLMGTGPQDTSAKSLPSLSDSGISSFLCMLSLPLSLMSASTHFISGFFFLSGFFLALKIASLVNKLAFHWPLLSCLPGPHFFSEGPVLGPCPQAVHPHILYGRAPDAQAINLLFPSPHPNPSLRTVALHWAARMPPPSRASFLPAIFPASKSGSKSTEVASCGSAHL